MRRRKSLLDPLDKLKKTTPCDAQNSVQVIYITAEFQSQYIFEVSYSAAAIKNDLFTQILENEWV